HPFAEIHRIGIHAIISRIFPTSISAIDVGTAIRRSVIESDLAGMAHKKTSPGLPAIAFSQSSSVPMSKLHEEFDTGWTSLGPDGVNRSIRELATAAVPINQEDAAIFLKCMSGAHVPGNPHCAE